MLAISVCREEGRLAQSLQLGVVRWWVLGQCSYFWFCHCVYVERLFQVILHLMVVLASHLLTNE